jgi:hypothetical protein
MMQVGAIYIWTYTYPIMRISASKKTEEIVIDGSSNGDNNSRETSHLYSEIDTEALLPSKGCPGSEEYMDQVEVPSTGSKEKAKVSSICCGSLSIRFKSFFASKFDFHST